MLLAIFALTALGLIYFTIRRPPTAVAAVLLMFPLEQLGQASYPFLVRHGYITNVAVGLLVLLGLAIAAFRGAIIDRPNGPPKVRIAVALLFGYALTSIAWGPDPEIALGLWTKAGLYLIVAVGLAPLLLRSVSDFRWAISAFAVAGTFLVVAFVFFADWTYRGIVSEEGESAITLPLALAEFAGLLFLTVTLMRIRSESRLLFALRVGVAVCCLALVFNTSSRGQLLVMFAVFAAFYPLVYRIGNLKGFLAGVTVLIVFVAVGIHFYETKVADQSRWQVEGLSRAAPERLSQGLRLLEVWAGEGLATWVFGLGNSAAYDKDILGFHPHNVPIEILCEEGLIGMALFVFILAASLRAYRNADRALQPRQEDRQILFVLGAYTLFFFLLSLKQGSVLSTYLFVAPILLERFARATQATHMSGDSTGRSNRPAKSGRLPPRNFVLGETR